MGIYLQALPRKSSFCNLVFYIYIALSPDLHMHLEAVLTSRLCNTILTIPYCLGLLYFYHAYIMPIGRQGMISFTVRAGGL